jgi:8-oxo-dGTP diphosphatase
MKNFPIIDSKTGREYWISRSVAVIIIFFAYNLKGKQYILTVKRGKGTPDPEYVGARCLPCGYLDFDETTQEAAARELFEETGIKVNPDDLKLLSINDNPSDDKRQNITFRYFIEVKGIPVEGLSQILTNKFSEEEEVDSVQFTPVADVSSYRWAFNHDKIINQLKRTI